MNCTEFEEIVHDLDRPGAHGVAVRERALAHAESCGRCAQLLNETESLDLALRVIATQEDKQEAPAWMEPVLLREFRCVKAGAPEPSIGRHIAALGIAAAVLLAAGVSLHRFAPSLKGTGAGQGIQANGSAAATPNQNGQRGQAGARVEQSVAENESGFIALPYADDPDGVEGGTVVRVELSGPALASLGMPVSLTGSSGSIPADLLVSDDGTPQAIRLLSQESASQEF
jgi:hypothetical protein